MYSIITPESFLRRAAGFFRKHPDLRDRVRDVVDALSQDPFQPRLRLHPLRGQLAGLHAVSLTYEYRVVLTLELTEHEIRLIDIGSHDEVYRWRARVHSGAWGATLPFGDYASTVWPPMPRGARQVGTLPCPDCV
jgi:mRNA-degrading endonuclease YafQ of YafQ-DinJ toxin-antitoxin module